jgi:hypothetical protein
MSCPMMALRRAPSNADWSTVGTVVLNVAPGRFVVVLPVLLPP